MQSHPAMWRDLQAAQQRNAAQAEEYAKIQAAQAAQAARSQK